MAIARTSQYPHPCHHPTCTRATRTPYCELHTIEYAARERIRQEQRQQNRPTSTERGYGGVWRQVRDIHLSRYPYCSTSGCNKRAAIVDHITPLRHGGTHATHNLQSLCNSCHASKTRREQADDRRRTER